LLRHNALECNWFEIKAIFFIILILFSASRLLKIIQGLIVIVFQLEKVRRILIQKEKQTFQSATCFDPHALAENLDGILVVLSQVDTKIHLIL
jgi:hypothetical protein